MVNMPSAISNREAPQAVVDKRLGRPMEGRAARNGTNEILLIRRLAGSEKPWWYRYGSDLERARTLFSNLVFPRGHCKARNAAAP